MPKRKRPPGEGSIYQRKDGRWVASRTIGATTAGHPRRILAYGRTQGEARRKLERKVEDLGGMTVARTLPKTGSVTLKQWSEAWLRSCEQDPQIKPLTVDAYRRVMRLHVVPTLGDRMLHTIRPAHVADLRDGLATLSPTSRAHVLAILARCLGQAVELELIRSNPASGTAVRRPRGSTREMIAWEPGEVARFLAAAQEKSPAHPLFHLCLVTGVRRGELLALRWSSVDLDAGRVSVVATVAWDDVEVAPKSKRGKRSIPIDAETVSILRAHRARQLEVQAVAAQEGLSRGGWEYVASTSSGSRMYPTQLQRLWYDALAAAEVRPIRFHDMRHTAATLWLRAGLAPHVVGQRLGHADPSITMRVYAHVLEDQQQAAAMPLATMLGLDHEDAKEAPAN